MRLLHTCDWIFKEFEESRLSKYAILSHTWGTDEISYHDLVVYMRMKEHTDYDMMSYKLKPKRFQRDGLGFRKIVGSRRLAAKRGYDWIWLDTCCIDKSSSAELSDAINSMFRWYQISSICLAYLSDVKTSTNEVYQYANSDPVIRRSRRFKRG